MRNIMKLTLSISPCPNDTFMFDALINKRIDTAGFEFDVTFADIEELNRAALSGTPDISKISYAVYPLVKDNYKILAAGSALGRGNGPLLVTGDDNADISDFGMRVAIPGVNTTANLLMNKLYPHISNKHPYLFSDIMDIVERGECDAGVLIHEGRFVYHKMGLFLLADLGIEWEERTGLPLPLGAIAIADRLGAEVKSTVNSLVRKSVLYALTHPDDSREFVRSHAQEMDPQVIGDHIKLFVNDLSKDLGEEGKKSAEELLGFSLDGLIIR